MLEADKLRVGDHLEIRDDHRPAEGGESGLKRLSMFVGRKGELEGREVGLLRGDILVVESKPRKVEGKLVCRVRRALSQSIGEILWSELQAAAIPRTR